MEITGFDTVVFTSGVLDQVLAKFISRMTSIWPELIMDVECLDRCEEQKNLRTTEDCLRVIRQERHPIVYFFRSHDMRDFLENNGYILDGSAEGPFAVSFSTTDSSRFWTRQRIRDHIRAEKLRGSRSLSRIFDFTFPA